MFRVPSLTELIRHRYTYPCAIILISLLGLAMRLHGLNDTPVWTDESFTYIVAELPARVLLFGKIDNHPPLYYLIQHIWQAVFPNLAFIRWPSALIGALTVPVAALAAGDLISRRAGLFAGAFLALSTAHIYFSQEARMYTLVCLGLCLALWGLIGCLQRPNRLLYGGLYLVGGAIAIYSHAIGLFYLIALNAVTALALCVQVDAKDKLIRFSAVNALLLLISLPWLWALRENSATFPGLSRAGPEFIPWMLMNNIGFPGLDGGVKALAGLALLGLFIYGSVRLWRAGDIVLPLMLLGSLCLYPLLIAVLNLHVNLIANRVFLPCAIAAAFLFAVSVNTLPTRALQISALVIVSALSLASSLLEHSLRMKVENVPYTLAAAATKGASVGPVIGCGFFGTITTHLLAPDRPAYYLLGSSFMRVNDGYEKTFAMPINNHRTFDAQTLDRYAGGGLIVSNPKVEWQAYNHIVVLTTYCDAARLAPTYARLKDLGFTRTGTIAPPALRLTLEADGSPAELWTR